METDTFIHLLWVLNIDRSFHKRLREHGNYSCEDFHQNKNNRRRNSRKVKFRQKFEKEMDL